MWNVHRMSIKIEHLRLLSSGTKLFITFEFFDIRWAIHILSILVFSSAPPHLVRYLPKASASKRKSTLFVRCPVLCPVLNFTNFLQNSPNPPRASGAWRHSHLLSPFPTWTIVTSLSDTSAPPAHAREHLR